MSDSDLQNYGGTSSFNADPYAAEILIPTDGKKITADANTSGKAPVNRGTKQLKDFANGLHDAVIGSRSGAQMKTLKSLHVDGTGGVNTGASAGNVLVSQADIDVSQGNVNLDLGLVRVGPAAGQRVLHSSSAVLFYSTASAGGQDANPPVTTPQENKVTAKNTCKAWISLTTDGMGDYTVHDGFNVASIALSSAPNLVTVTFASSMADNNYSVTVAGSDNSETFSTLYSRYIHADKTASAFPLGLKNDPTTEVMHIDLHFFGKQDTP